MLVQITGWRQYMEDGEKFLACAINAATMRRHIFTPAILYNINAMAIEKFLMGFLMCHGALAENHTMVDILRSVEHIAGPQPELANEFRYLDSFQEICDMDAFNRRDPEWDEVPRMLECGVMVKEFALKGTRFVKKPSVSPS
ncbi:MAG: hypothetical protein KKD63_15000 [Proteobacteria bacterium]|nr:hypothetical protein [Desulfobulbaceae bacterium]MBU4154176.1 hypothetical protein [Pseudomonadota bacterium]MDP2104390.1 hypothetical protein [Desulfobulbaceae bacterium]